jgi:hypothetical protein
MSDGITLTDNNRNPAQPSSVRAREFEHYRRLRKPDFNDRNGIT